MSSLKELSNNVNAWPVQEALKILEKINNKTPEKGYVLFETGYGPSGLPHIGTFGEVARTSIVRYAFEQISGMKTRLFAFSDDMDGLRKVPSNVPNQEMLSKYINFPLTKVPDPFEKFASFGEHNNYMLRQFLDKFGFSYEFCSATELYKSGKFNDTLIDIARNYDEIMAVMLPTLGEERQETYSAFLPIDKITGKVLLVSVVKVDADAKTIIYKDDNGKLVETSFLDGNCKLQWKVDWAMRWANLSVDYEMSGKDLIPSVELSSKICKIIGKKPPVSFSYELFLDEEGRKISKSKGNGISIDDWLRYGNPDSLSIFMYQKPKTAKRLYFDSIPRAVDDWLSLLISYKNEEFAKKVENPVHYIYSGNPPQATEGITFQLLLNLAGVCHSDDKEMLWNFVRKYKPNLSETAVATIDNLLVYAINYYTDFIKPTISYRAPTESEVVLLKILKDKLSDKDCPTDADLLMNMIYSVAKDNGADIKGWFSTLYETLLGQKQGPRFGSFTALYGVSNVVALIDGALARK